MKTTPKNCCNSVKPQTAVLAGRGVLTASLPARHCGSLKTTGPNCTKAAITKVRALIVLGLMLTGANALAATLAGAKSTDSKAAAPAAQTTAAAKPAALAPSAPHAAGPGQPQSHFAPGAPLHTPTSPAASEEDIRDIRSPKHLPPAWLWAAYTAGALVLACAAFGAWCWYRRDKVLVKLPYEIALDRLEEARRFMTPEQAHAFCTEVSEVIRGYIEFRFNVRAAHRTTEEFLHDLLEEKQDKLAAHRASLAEFLQHCDLAKFALWQFSVSEMEAMHGSARVFVLQSAIDAAMKTDTKKSAALPKSPRVHLDPPAPAAIHGTPKPA
jgi:hypothetical protein